MYLSSFANRERKIKTAMGLHLVLVRMAIIKTTNDAEDWGGGEYSGPLFTAGGNVNGASHCANPYGGSSKATNGATVLPMYTTTLHIYPENREPTCHRDSHVYHNAVHNDHVMP